MRKQIVVLLLVLLPVLSFADAKDWWFGGAARMMSMGEMTAALPDYSNVYDLYSFGFPTSLLWRAKKSVVDFTPMANIRNLATGNVWNDFGTQNSFIGFRLGDNNVIALRPDYSKQDNREKFTQYPGGEQTDFDNSMNSYDLNGEIQYMHKITNDIGVSVSIFSLNSSSLTYVNFIDPITTVNSWLNYSEKDAGVSLCLDRHLGDIQIPFISNFLPRLDVAVSCGYKVKDRHNTGYLYDDDAGTTDTSLEKENDRLINVNLGVAFTAPEKKSNLVLNMTKSFVVDYTYYYNSTSATSTGVVIDETRFDLNAKLDYYFTDFLLGSVRMQWMDPDYEAAVGLALVTDIISIPLEYYKNDINGHAESYGGGLEFNFIKPACVRLGARRHSFYANRIDYTAGLGLETNLILCDIGMAYVMENGVWARTNLLADIKAVW